MVAGRAEDVEFLAIAKILKAHGLKGFVEVQSLTDFPTRFRPGITLYAARRNLTEKRDASKAEDAGAAAPVELVIETIQEAGKGLLLKFEGVEKRSSAERLKGSFLQVPIAEAVPLPEGSYWHHQIEGLSVVTEAGIKVGTIASILKTGSNDVYVVSAEHTGKEILIPATKEVVKEVNLDTGRIVITPLPGLLD